MKWKRGLSLFSATALLCGTLSAGAVSAAADTAENITPDAPELKLVYDAPPANMGTMSSSGQNGSWDGNSWEQEALPLGNGFIGAMVFGDQLANGVLDDRIQVNEHTLWSGGPGKNANYEMDIFKNNGAATTKAKVQKAVRELQESLQAKVTAFTAENEAHYAETGEYLNYPGYYTETSYLRDTAQAQTENSLLAQIKGHKGDFGSYQTMGDIHIQNSATAYTDYERGLDLNTATAWVSYDQGGATFRKEYFVSNPDNVMVIRLTADGGTIDRTVTVSSVQTQKTVSVSAADGTITMVGSPADQKTSYGLDEKLVFAQQVKVIPVGGSLSAVTNGLKVAGASEVLILMSAATNYVQDDGDEELYDFFSGVDPLDTVKETLAAAEKLGYQALQERHLADYTELFDRVQLSLNGAQRPDKTTDLLVKEYPSADNPLESRYLETLYYQYGRYLLIASSREGSLPANLQGIWADSLNPPWDADYHTNVNLQMNYWLAQQTNLDECQDALNRYINSLVPYGEKTAQWYHVTGDGQDGVRGWTDYHENNIWGYTNPAVSEAYYAPEGAAWLCQALWEDYAFTQDIDELEANFDAMLGAAIFWVDTLWTDERDGLLVANPSYSPEHGTYTLGATFTQSIIWELFTDVSRAADALGDRLSEEQKSMAAEVAAALEKLYIPEVNEETGLYPEWKDMTAFDIAGTDTPDSTGKHRHTNQLAGLHPGSMVVAGRSDEDDTIVAAMKNTLANRGDGGTGWGKAWKMCMWARLRDGDHAYLMLNGLLKAQKNGGSTYQNLLDTHAPFQIDGNFGATAGITEMMLQSQGDAIDLFAAMPTAWDSGAVSGLKARGNFTVGMEWSGRKLQRAQITSGSGGNCVLSYKGLSTARIVTADGAEIASVYDAAAGTLTFATEAGKTYYVAEISQDIKLSSRETFLRANLNNLYSKDILTQTAAPEEIGDNGVFVEEVLEGSLFTSLGIEENEILTALNGQTVSDVEGLKALYAAIPDGETASLTVWNGADGEYRTVAFEKAAHNDYFHVPGTIQCEDYDARRYDDKPVSNGTALEFTDSGTWVRYSNIYFDGTPTSVTLCGATSGGDATSTTATTRSVYVKAAPAGSDYSEAKTIATVKITGQGWYVYVTGETTSVKEVTPGVYDVYLDFAGGVNVDWLTFGETVKPEPVDPPVDPDDPDNPPDDPDTPDTPPDTPDTPDDPGKPDAGRWGDVNNSGSVDTTDARLTLQFAAKRVKEEDLARFDLADVNGDGRVDTTDARLILQHAAKRIKTFPVEDAAASET